MGEFIEISDAEDPRLGDYIDLRDVSLRLSLEAEHGLFIAEGALVIRRACEAGYEPRSFLLAPKWVDGLRDLLDRGTAPVYLMPEALIETVTGFHVHRGALASMRRAFSTDPSALMGLDRLVVCEDIVDHANVGAIIRCAAGLGWDGVLLAPRAADPLYRRAVKTSMGAVFCLPWARMTEWETGLDQVRQAGFTLMAMALRDDARSLEDVASDLRGHPRRIALMLGTEGAGLSSHWLSQADAVVRIPMSRGIDSLNVAAAAAVACYALRKQAEVRPSESGEVGCGSGVL